MKRIIIAFCAAFAYHINDLVETNAERYMYEQRLPAKY